MNESSRNTRTLIVSFVVAIMALVPLRFVEAGQLAGQEIGQPQVLGEQVEVDESGSVQAAQDYLEAPYNEIDGTVLGASSSCVSAETARTEISTLESKVTAGGLTGPEIDSIVGQMMEIEKNTCR